MKNPIRNLPGTPSLAPPCAIADQRPVAQPFRKLSKRLRDLTNGRMQWVMLGLIAALASVGGSSLLLANANGLIQVTVRCEALVGMSDVRLKVLANSPLGVVIVPDAGASFNSQGECQLTIPEGEYIFEALDARPDQIIALRTPARRVTSGAVVEIRAEPAGPIELKRGDEPPLPVKEIAVRSAATMGEVVWNGDTTQLPKLLLSPGQQFRLRILGGSEKTRLAVWPVVSSKQLTVVLQGSNVARCRFTIRQDGPSIARAAVRFQFPDGEMRFPVTKDTEFLTNRRFLSFGYGIELTNGRRVLFRPWLGMVGADQEFVLGGPLTATAYARIMLRKPVGGPETHHLIWDADLYDPRGHMVLTEESQIDWTDSVRDEKGNEYRRGHPVLKSEVATFLASGNSLTVRASYTLDKPIQVSLRPDAFRPFGDRRFYTHAPPNWELQALNYVSRAERVFHMIEDLEGKPSKHKVEVRWHAMNGTAWGCEAASGGKAHIIMPFSGLRKSFNYYETPWALAHEMLHTFGYGHDAKMGRMTSLVEKRFNQYRWYMADHPQLDPEAAFVAFRAATRLPPGLVAMSMMNANQGGNSPSKEKGSGKKGKKKKK